MNARASGSAFLMTVSVRGIPLVISRSWPLALALTAVALGAGIETLLPGLSLAAVVAAGTLLALGVWASFLIHELAHALAARNAGVGIEHIQLFAAGAACRRLQTIDAPREQFVVAAAGLLASAALGAGLLGVAVAGGLLGLPRAPELLLALLALVNIMAALANLLPVFPFDGGKLVHALYWRDTRDRQAASAQLRTSGREFSRVITTLGLLFMTFGGELAIGFVLFLFGVYLLRLPPAI